MGKRVFSREFKLEAVKLVRERGVSQAQAARDLGLHVNVLRKWVKDFAADPQQAFPGRGKMKPDDAEVTRLRRELEKTKAERDILKNVWSAPVEQSPSSIFGTSRFASMYPAYVWSVRSWP